MVLKTKQGDDGFFLSSAATIGGALVLGLGDGTNTAFFNPTSTSLRGLQQASTLETVQRRLGIRATSLGSFSEAARVLGGF